MYKTFFNLKLNPFELTPDPAFLFTTRRHNEALAALLFLVPPLRLIGGYMLLGSG